MEQSHFAIVYADENKAQFALQTLKKLHQQGHLSLKKSTLLTRQADGQVLAQASTDFNWVNPKYGVAGFAGTVAGFIGAAPLGPAVLLMAPLMGAVGTAAAIGYDMSQKNTMLDSLRSSTEASMQEGSSALIVQADIVNLNAVLRELGRLGSGKVIHENPNLAAHKQLQNLLNEKIETKPVVVAQNEAKPVPVSQMEPKPIIITKSEARPVSINRAETKPIIAQTETKSIAIVQTEVQAESAQ